MKTLSTLRSEGTISDERRWGEIENPPDGEDEEGNDFGDDEGLWSARSGSAHRRGHVVRDAALLTTLTPIAEQRATEVETESRTIMIPHKPAQESEGVISFFPRLSPTRLNQLTEQELRINQHLPLEVSAHATGAPR